MDVIEEESMSRVKVGPTGSAAVEAEEVRPHNPLVGSVVLSLHQIHQALGEPLWQTILDSNGLPCGELHVKYAWNRGKAKGKFVQVRHFFFASPSRPDNCVDHCHCWSDIVVFFPFFDSFFFLFRSLRWFHSTRRATVKFLS